MRQTHSRPSAAPAPAEDDDPVPEDIDEFRNELARRIAKFIGNRTQAWRGCRERACRRARACLAPNIHCSNAPPNTSTPEEKAAVIARVQQAIRETLARRQAERDPK